MEKLKRILHTAYKSIKQYKYTVLTLLYFFLIVSYPVNFTFRLLPLLGCISVLFVLNIIARAKLKVIWTSILIILTTFNAYVAFVYSSYISSSIIAVIFETNNAEIKSAIGGILLSGILLLLVSSALIILSQKELKNSKLSVKNSLLTLVIFLSVLSSISYRRVLIINDLREEYNNAPIEMYSRALNYYTPFLYGNIMVIASYIHDIYLFNTYINSDKQMPEGIEIVPDKPKLTKLFIIVGESANLKHLSIFGYEVPTTPFMNSLSVATDSVYAYKGKSVSSQTRNAVPGILTSNHGRNINLFRNEYSIIDMAKKNGYTTYWISNQYKKNLWNGRDIIGALAGRTDYFSFPPNSDIIDDLTLLPEIEKYYENNDKKQLFIIHLQGSHFLYEDRYDEVDEKALPGESTLLRQYDRSIHHTDRFLEQLYKYASKSNSSAILYLSDHGQEIKKEFGHGVGKPTMNQFYVPIVGINHSPIPLNSVMAKYIDPQDSIISNNSIMEIAAELIGYTVSKEKIARSIEDGRYVLHGDDYVYQFSDLE